MDGSVAIEAVLDKLPVAELEQSLSDFIAPFTAVLPDARLRQVVPLAVRGVVAGESPLVTAMAQSVARSSSSSSSSSSSTEEENAVWAAAKRIYRFLGNPRLSVDLLQEGLYERARATIEEEKPERVVVALDPVNFEKPYTHKLEGVSTVYKSTPPDRRGKAPLARGYPAITATVVNTRAPATKPMPTGSPIPPTSSARTGKSGAPSTPPAGHFPSGACASLAIAGWMTRRSSSGSPRRRRRPKPNS